MTAKRKSKSRKLTVLSLFDGLGGARLALDRLDIPCDYYASEIDKPAMKVSAYHFPDIIQLGDVTRIKAKDLPRIDLLVGGSPCTDLSVLKTDGLGLQGEASKLFFEWVRLRDELNPSFWLLENVRCKDAGEMSRHVGTDYVPVNSSLFVAQNRPRLYWSNLSVPPLPPMQGWDRRYVQISNRGYWRSPRGGVSPAVTTAPRGYNDWYRYEGPEDQWPIYRMPVEYKADGKTIIVPDNFIRPTVEECEQLQGLPVGYTDVAGVSKTQRKKMIGNGFTTPVIMHLLSPLQAIFKA